jgi:transposase-like protein
MKLAEREEQILRVKSQSFQSEMTSELENTLRTEVTGVIKATIEVALVEELESFRASRSGPQARRSGYFHRLLDTQYGRIPELRVPKLRDSNHEREWQILKRYQRGLQSLLDMTLCLYVLGLSLRDLQEALYHLLGSVLSLTAVNRVTLEAQKQMEARRQSLIEGTPPILIVDGVWIDILYTLDEFKLDRAGHQRQVRQAQERVILAAMAVWPDGTYQLLHYEIAEGEDSQSWLNFFTHLIERGLEPQAVKLIVSDGISGLPGVITQCLPNAQQQRCTTHKVRGMKRYLTYQQLSASSEVTAAEFDEQQAKQQRRFEIQEDAYDIYRAQSWIEARQRLKAFVEKWQNLEAKAVEIFLRDIELTFTFYQFEAELHPRIRTSNLLERLFEEFRRKADEIGAFPNEMSCLTLFFLVVQRDHAKHNRPFL